MINIELNGLKRVSILFRILKLQLTRRTFKMSYNNLSLFLIYIYI
jgi:hypothetical protein